MLRHSGGVGPLCVGVIGPDLACVFLVGVVACPSRHIAGRSGQLWASGGPHSNSDPLVVNEAFCAEVCAPAGRDFRPYSSPSHPNWACRCLRPPMQSLQTSCPGDCRPGSLHCGYSPGSSTRGLTRTADQDSAWLVRAVLLRFGRPGTRRPDLGYLRGPLAILRRPLR